MNKISKVLKDCILNTSDQFNYYKSENTRLKAEVSSIQQKADQKMKILENENQKLFERVKELSPKNSKFESTKSQLKKNEPKKLKDIRTSQNRESLDNVCIGEYTYGTPNIECFAKDDKLIIGKFCSISKDVTILIGMQHNIDCISSYPFGPFMNMKFPDDDNKITTPQETVIGNDVWIGYGSLILSGVTIGDGAVIGARTVVSKDVEPYSIVAGSPMKLLRYRFPKDVRDILLEKKWWDLPDEKIEELAPYLIDYDINNLLKRL